MHLRTDLTKEEKKEAMKSCREVIKSYREDELLHGRKHQTIKGIFD